MKDEIPQCITTNWGGSRTESFIRSKDAKYKVFQCRLQFRSATDMGIILEGLFKISGSFALVKCGVNEFWGNFWYFEAEHYGDSEELKEFCEKYKIVFRGGN